MFYEDHLVREARVLRNDLAHVRVHGNHERHIAPEAGERDDLDAPRTFNERAACSAGYGARRTGIESAQQSGPLRQPVSTIASKSH